MRGVRGAITVEENTKEAIWKAAGALASAVMERNGIEPGDIGAAIFSATEDLTAAFPTTGMRQLPGMEAVPLFDARQMGVEGSLSMCIRLLLLIDTEKAQKEIVHVYLGGAKALRPDLSR